MKNVFYNEDQMVTKVIAAQRPETITLFLAATEDDVKAKAAWIVSIHTTFELDHPNNPYTDASDSVNDHAPMIVAERVALRVYHTIRMQNGL